MGNGGFPGRSFAKVTDKLPFSFDCFDGECNMLFVFRLSLEKGNCKVFSDIFVVSGNIFCDISFKECVDGVFLFIFSVSNSVVGGCITPPESDGLTGIILVLPVGGGPVASKNRFLFVFGGNALYSGAKFCNLLLRRIFDGLILLSEELFCILYGVDGMESLSIFDLLLRLSVFTDVPLLVCIFLCLGSISSLLCVICDLFFFKTGLVSDTLLCSVVFVTPIDGGVFGLFL